MPSYETQIANEMKDQLMLCLGQVIEKAFHNKYGEKWFSELKRISTAEAQSNISANQGAVINKKWKKIDELDFAALLKVFAYLDEAVNIIAKYYKVESKKESIRKTALDLTKFRNSNAHKDIAKTKDEQHNINDQSYYNFGMAMDDMLYLSGFFRQEKAENGESYYSILLHMHNKYLNNRQAQNNSSASYVPPSYANGNVRSQNVYTAAPVKKKSKAPLILLAAVIAVFVAAVIIIFSVVSKTVSNVGSNIAGYFQNDAAITEQSKTPTEPTSQTTQKTTSAVSVSGSAEIDGLVFTVSKISGNTVTIDYENEQNSFSIGWVQSADVTAETTNGTYYSYLNDNHITIRPGDSDSFRVTFNDMSGDITKITISDIYLLSDRGLPSSRDGETVEITLN